MTVDVWGSSLSLGLAACPTDFQLPRSTFCDCHEPHYVAGAAGLNTRELPHLRSCSPTITPGSWCINTSAFSPLEWHNSETFVLDKSHNAPHPCHPVCNSKHPQWYLASKNTCTPAPPYSACVPYASQTPRWLCVSR